MCRPDDDEEKRGKSGTEKKSGTDNWRQDAEHRDGLPGQAGRGKRRCTVWGHGGSGDGGTVGGSSGGGSGSSTAYAANSSVSTGSGSGRGMAYADNKDASTDGSSGDGTDAAADSNSDGGIDFSKLWPFALIAIFGILLFYFSKDMLSSVFKKNEKKGNRSRNAKAMKWFMKYSK